MRHGEIAGYQAGCRKPCCRRAKKADRMMRERLIASGHAFQVDCARSRRKMQALAAMGWSWASIARDHLGITQQALSRILARDVIRATTAERIDRAYDALEMAIPEDTIYTRRTKNLARSAKWKPPLAWEDIDAGILADVEVDRAINHDHVDDFMVETALQYHDFTLRFTRAEKSEIVRRWKRSGKSERSLCALTGWREGRY
jgi:hypothetical protein